MAASPPARSIDLHLARYADQYGGAHGRRIHGIAGFAILWSLVALLWCIPVPGTLFGAGAWAAFASFAAWMFYYRASRPLGFGMLAVLIALLWLNRWLYASLGSTRMLQVAIAVFVLAWIAQFIGHKIEGKKPSFLTDLTYLLIGPVWVLSKFYRKMGWKY